MSFNNSTYYDTICDAIRSYSTDDIPLLENKTKEEEHLKNFLLWWSFESAYLRQFNKIICSLDNSVVSNKHNQWTLSDFLQKTNSVQNTFIHLHPTDLIFDRRPSKFLSLRALLYPNGLFSTESDDLLKYNDNYASTTSSKRHSFSYNDNNLDYDVYSNFSVLPSPTRNNNHLLSNDDYTLFDDQTSVNDKTSTSINNDFFTAFPKLDSFRYFDSHSCCNDQFVSSDDLLSIANTTLGVVADPAGAPADTSETIITFNNSKTSNSINSSWRHSSKMQPNLPPPPPPASYQKLYPGTMSRKTYFSRYKKNSSSVVEDRGFVSHQDTYQQRRFHNNSLQFRNSNNMRIGSGVFDRFRQTKHYPQKLLFNNYDAVENYSPNIEDCGAAATTTAVGHATSWQCSEKPTRKPFNYKLRHHQYQHHHRFKERHPQHQHKQEQENNNNDDYRCNQGNSNRSSGSNHSSRSNKSKPNCTQPASPLNYSCAYTSNNKGVSSLASANNVQQRFNKKHNISLAVERSADASEDIQNLSNSLSRNVSSSQTLISNNFDQNKQQELLYSRYEKKNKNYHQKHPNINIHYTYSKLSTSDTLNKYEMSCNQSQSHQQQGNFKSTCAGGATQDEKASSYEIPPVDNDPSSQESRYPRQSKQRSRISNFYKRKYNKKAPVC